MKEINQYSSQIKFFTGNPKWWEDVLFKNQCAEGFRILRTSNFFLTVYLICMCVYIYTCTSLCYSIHAYGVEHLGRVSFFLQLCKFQRSNSYLRAGW